MTTDALDQRDLDAINANIEGLRDEVRGLRADMNGRLRSLEVWRGYVVGAVTLLGVLFGSGAAWLVLAT